MVISRLRLFLSVLLLTLAGAVCAQEWPSRPVRIVVPVGAGSFGDILARMLADELQAVTRQPFVVENKPGASGIIAADLVAKAAPDGYTLLLMTNSAHSAAPHLLKKVPYEPVRDFTPIARICYVPFLLLVGQESPIRSLEDLIARARAAPGSMTYGFGNTTAQIAGAALVKLSGLQAVAVPFKSTPQALAEAVAGRLDFLFNDAGSSESLLKARRVRPIAVSSPRRSALLPETPTVAEGARLPGFSVAAWAGIGGPAGLPVEVVRKVGDAVLALAARKSFVDRLAAMGAEPAPAAASDFGTYLVEQYEIWARKTQEAGIEKE